MDFIALHDYSWDSFHYMLGTSDIAAQEYELANRETKRTCCFLYEKMMSFPKFRNHFIASYATYLGDFLRPDVCVPIIRAMDEEIIDEIPHTFAAFENMSTLKRHNTGIERLCNYVKNRPLFVYQQMADYFSLGDVIPVTVTAEPSEEFKENGGVSITVSNTPLRTGRFDGAWFTSLPLSLYSDAEDAAWVMTVTHSDGVISSETIISSSFQPDFTALTSEDSVAFVATTANMVDHITSNHISHRIAAIYDTTGKRHQTMQKGINIVLYSDGTRRKLFNTK